MSTANKYSRPFFSFNPADKDAAGLAQHLQNELGTFNLTESDVVVSIGGDGSILHALHNTPPLPVFAIKPAGSNSKLFHGHFDITNGATLISAFNNVSMVTLVPLRADINLSDHAPKTIYAYGDIFCTTLNAQATLVDIELNELSHRRIMSGGILTATALGSTARNQSYGGHVLPLTDHDMVVTADGELLEDFDEFFAPGLNSRMIDEGSVLTIRFSSHTKRPPVIHYDSSTIMPDGNGFTGFPLRVEAPCVTGLTITQATPDHMRLLLRNPQFATHAIP